MLILAMLGCCSSQVFFTALWLNNAAIHVPHNFHCFPIGWINCTVVEVEETKLLLRMVPISATFLLYGAIKFNSDTFFIAQGHAMNRSFRFILQNKRHEIQLPVQIFGLMAGFATFAVKPLYRIVFEQRIERMNGRYSAGMKVGLGMLAALASCKVAWWVEYKRLKSLKEHSLLGNPNAIAPISVFWLSPQFFVLGTGALQVAGLKSITSKHLALASQVISFMDGIIPEIRRILFMKVLETRKALLLSEIDRVALDYKIHRDEIHTKLVQIMRERLFVHLRGLPQIVEGWNRPEDADSLPSQFARSLTKEVGYFQRVLSKTLHEFDVHVILRQVVIIFHSQISEAFSRLDISTPEARNRLHRDVQHILACIRLLPCDDMRSGTPNWGQLDELLVQRFGPEAGE